MPKWSEIQYLYFPDCCLLEQPLKNPDQHVGVHVVQEGIISHTITTTPMCLPSSKPKQLSFIKCRTILIINHKPLLKK